MGCGASAFRQPKDELTPLTIVPQDSEADDADAEVPRDIRDFYVLGEVLGSGAFGQVRSATLIEEPSECRAVKVLEKDGTTSRSDLDLEIDLLGQLEHENIICFCEFFEDVHFLYVVTERCAGGEVFEKILELKRFTEANAALMGKQMLAAIEYIHQKRIAHRDIKAENFLLAEPTIHSKVKMIDFGMACRVEEGQFMTELCGSPHYVAPELIGKRYTELVDVWAFGVLLYLLMYGEYPYDAKEPREIMIKVLTMKIRWQKRVVLSEMCLGLLTRLLQHDSEQRFSAREAAKHPWFDCEGAVQIPKEVLRSAHRKITSSRKAADPEVEELRNQKLRRLEEDWKKGLRHPDLRLRRPEVLRRENRLMTAPSSVKEPHADASADASGSRKLETKGCVANDDETQNDLRCPGGPDLAESDEDISTARLPGPIKSSQSFPEPFVRPRASSVIELE